MMRSLKFTLLCDDTSDRMLISILEWMLRRHLSNIILNSEVADLSRIRNQPKRLQDRIRYCFDLYPADVLFVHRDAEREEPAKRAQEIMDALQRVQTDKQFQHNIPVIPVRTTEAWLLISEQAIRRASGNPNGSVTLELPRINSLESLPDPKEELEKLLKTASERRGRMLKKFNFPEARQRVSEYINDWSSLLQLPAARELDQRIQDLSNHI